VRGASLSPLHAPICSAFCDSGSIIQSPEILYADEVADEYTKNHTPTQFEDSLVYLDTEQRQLMIESDCVKDEYSFDWQSEKCCSDSDKSPLSSNHPLSLENGEKVQHRHELNSESLTLDPMASNLSARSRETDHLPTVSVKIVDQKIMRFS
jgi:hypothetical protein